MSTCINSMALRVEHRKNHSFYVVVYTSTEPYYTEHFLKARGDHLFVVGTNRSCHVAVSVTGTSTRDIFFCRFIYSQIYRKTYRKYRKNTLYSTITTHTKRFFYVLEHAKRAAGHSRQAVRISILHNYALLIAVSYRENRNIFLDKFDPGKCHFTDTKLHL